MIGGLASAGMLPLVGCAGSSSHPIASTDRAIAQPPVTVPNGLDAVIDISHTAMVSDFALARSRSNILGVVHKASEGGDWRDPAYSERRGQAEAANMLWGAYHFGTRMYSGADQAAAFLAAAQPGPDTLLALDLELNERYPANTMDIHQAEDFVLAILMTTGRLPLLYTHPTWAEGRPMGKEGRTLGGAIGPDSVLAQCDLWLADYHGEPQLPTAWAASGWRFWQYAGDTGTGSGWYQTRAVHGVDRCDRNLFTGDADALYRYWNAAGGTQS